MSSIKDRVVQVLEAQKIPKESFFKSIGMTSSNFRGDAKKTPLNSDAIANILSKLPQINALWLLTGDGEMECSVNKTTQGQTDVLEKIYSLNHTQSKF